MAFVRLKDPGCYSLVESYRDDAGRVRQRTVLYLGRSATVEGAIADAVEDLERVESERHALDAKRKFLDGLRDQPLYRNRPFSVKDGLRLERAAREAARLRARVRELRGYLRSTVGPRAVPAPAPRLRTPLKWHGGKSYLAGWIIPHLPRHRVYVEPFAGGLSVLLSKRPSPVEVASDMDHELMNFLTMLRDRTGEFLDGVNRLDYDAETFASSIGAGPPGSGPLEDALRFLVRVRYSRDGLGRDFAWSERLRGGRPGDLNAWETFKPELPAIAGRLARVELHRREALDVIREYDGPDTLFYLDPPYHPETRTARRMYESEMDALDHAELIDVILGCRSRVAISGYAHPLYDRALRRWRRFEKDMPNHSGQGSRKQRRTEVLWVKPPARGSADALTPAPSRTRGPR